MPNKTMKNAATLVIALSLYAFAFLSNANEYQSVIDEIVAMNGASEKNQARLQELFSHPNEGVEITAKMRAAQIYYTSARASDAEALFSELLSNVEDYSYKYQVEVHLAKGMFEFYRNNFIEAEAYALKALEIAEANYEDLIPSSLSVLSSALNRQGNWVEGKNYMERALQEYKNRKDMKSVFRTLNNLGAIYRDVGNLAEAISYYQQAREILGSGISKGNEAALLYNLGDIYLDTQEPEKALEYYQNALAIDLELGDIGNAAFDYQGVTSANIALEKFDKALESNLKGIQLLLQLSAPEQLSRSYIQQAAIYKRLDDQTNRLKSLNLAKEITDDYQLDIQTMRVDIEFGIYYFQQQALKKALEVFSGALKIATQIEQDNHKQTIHSYLARIHEQLGDFETTVFHLNKSAELKDKLNSEDQRERIEKYKRDVNLLEEQLKVSELTQSKLEQEKQKLFADVSHELRTPLTALKLQIQALEDNLVTDVQSGYQKLNRKVSEINRLITDIYQLAKADSLSIDLDVKSHVLSSTFKEWEKDWQAFTTGAGFEWECKIEVGDASIDMDSDRIKQVIDNLLSNSTFYTDIPGKIMLSASYVQNQLVVSVEDTAPTVEQSNLEKIFTRLYRVEKSRSRQTGGSGLGLAICESLIKAHKGTISASQSQLGGLKVEFRM